METALRSLNLYITVGRQTQRSNPPSSSPKDYYRISYNNEFLSHIVSELENRFQAQDVVSGLLHLLPNICTGDDESAMGVPSELLKAVEFYKDDLPCPLLVPTEYGL